MIRFTIEGQPITKKNGKMIARNRLISKPVYQKWQADAVEQLQSQWQEDAIPKDTPLNMCAVFYMQTRRMPDLSNLYEGIQDAMQSAGVIEDDACICGHDGSCRRYDKDRPRIEIVLRELNEGRGDYWRRIRRELA